MATNRETVVYGCVRAAGLIALVALGVGCMEESPELMMGGGGPPPGEGPPPANQAGGPPPGNAEVPPPQGGPEGKPGEGAPGAPGDGSAEGAPPAAAEGGPGAGDEDGEKQGGAPDAAAKGEKPPGETDPAHPPVDARGVPVKEPTEEVPAKTEEASPGLLARLFSSQKSGSAPSSPTFSGSGGTSGSSRIPRVQQTVADKPKYTVEELEDAEDTVTILGTIECSVCEGSVLLNVVGSQGLLVSKAGLETGEFRIKVPRNIGNVSLTAIGDDNGDGVPSAGEPLGGYMKNPINVDEEDLIDIAIRIGAAPPPGGSETSAQ